LKVEIEIKLRLAGELTQIRADVRKLGFRISKRRAFESNILFDNVKRTLRKHGKLPPSKAIGTEPVQEAMGDGNASL
jgi:hypothetical protein